MKPGLKSYLYIASCMAGLLLGERCCAAERTDDETAIHAVVAAFGHAMNAKDAAAFGRVFHVDADFTNWRGMSAQGRKAIEEFHRLLFEGDGAKDFASFRNAVLQVVGTHVRFIRPDVASVEVRWTQTGAVRNGIKMGLRKGLTNWIATKEGGKWGIAVMHNAALPDDAPAGP